MDYSGNAYHGSNSGVTFVSGQVNNAGDFENSESDHISLPNLQSFSILSISLWVKMESDIGSNVIILDLKATNSRLLIYYVTSNNKINTRVQNSLGSATDSIGIDVNDGNYHQIVLTYDGSNVRLYQDNVLIDTDAQTGTIDLSNLTYGYLGAQLSTPQDFWDGTIDDVRIFDHVLTAVERKRLFAHTGKFEVEVGGTDYSMNLNDFTIKRESLYFPGEFEVELIDPGNVIIGSLERYKEIKIKISGITKFKGINTNVLRAPNNKKIILLPGFDKSWLIHKMPVLKGLTANTSSQVLTSIINAELASYGFGTGSITATVETNDYLFNHMSAGSIFTKRAEAENFWWYVEVDDNVVFRARTAVDSGVALDYGNNDIRKYKFEKQGGDIVNQVRVIGAPGRPPATKPIGTIVEDDDLIDKYKFILPMITINHPELTTKEQCQEAGENEIRRRNQDPDLGWVKIPLNLNVNIAELITLTLAPENYTTQLFTVQTEEHRMKTNITTLNLVYYTRDTSDLVENILETGRRAEFQISDQSLIFTKIKKLIESLILTAFVTVDRRTIAGAQYGEFNYGGKYYGQVNTGSWTNVISAQKIQITNQFLTDFLAVIGQITTVPSDLSGANARIAVGSGATAIDVSDNGALENESNRLTMEPGFPFRSAAGTVDWRIIINDATAETLTIANTGLFNSASGANREIAGVLSSSVAKAADEDIRITMQAVLTGNKITANGINALMEMIISVLSDYIDTGAFIEIVLDGAPLSSYNEVMASGFPKFMNVAKDRSRYQIELTGAEVLANGIDGEIFTEMDLYNGDPSTEIKIIDGVVASVTLSQLQDYFLQFDIIAGRG